ncbi:NUDIX domain-containing protein [Streptomyces youssoufiensis]
MSEETPRFVYLYAGCCDDRWLAAFDLPSRAESKLIDLAPTYGWARQADGTWYCDQHSHAASGPPTNRPPASAPRAQTPPLPDPPNREANMTESFVTTRYTADVVCLTPGGTVLLVERGWAPFEGAWALPGGHLDPGESSREAAVRELAEETGVHVAADDLREIGTWAEAGRDPRGRYSTDAYLAIVPAGTQIAPGTDARRVRWWPLSNLPERLAFDHADILSAATAP